MRILGKGKTAKAINEVYLDAIMFDDTNKDIYDINSDELTVVSPGIPPDNFLVKNSKNLISEYDLFCDTIPFSVCISGTNGKTTTTQMLQHLLKDKNSICGGNIGVPLAKMDTKANIWILETSSFTLHYTKRYKPHIYILLPISEDHISWHGSFKNYENSKLKPLSLMCEEDIAIVPKKYKGFKTKAKTFIYENSLDLAKQFNIDSSKIDFKEPFLMDSILALCVDKIINNRINYKLINNFIQDSHKLEEFKDKQGRVWIDDSKATNIDATIQAVKTYKDKKIYLILGGDDKGANLIPLFEEINSYDIEIFSIGKNIDKISKLSNQYNMICNRCFNLEEAVKSISLKLVNSNFNVALLSPAAASLDQFNSYKQRGKEFKKFINFI